MDKRNTNIRIFITEILRKWPVGASLDRICTKPYILQTGNSEQPTIELPKDSQIWIPVHGIHRDPDNYPDPEKFNPERFSDENKNDIKPYTYMPFGEGPRNCIGSRFALLETKVLLYKILSKFQIIPTKKTKIPLTLSKDFAVKAEGGFWFGLKRI